jgi:uncharacterized hydantoinase/oxoprolinase family protein
MNFTIGAVTLALEKSKEIISVSDISANYDTPETSQGGSRNSGEAKLKLVRTICDSVSEQKPPTQDSAPFR